MNQSVPRISLIILMQNDLEASVAFYEKLGYKLNFHIKDQWAEFEAQGIKLGLAYTQTELPERRTGIVLEVDDIKSFCNELSEKAIECSDYVESIHGIMSSIKDPGNNILELYQPTPERVKEAVEKTKKAT
jgi:predicted enzyme related to lactoylglutathione lyase